MPPHKTYFLEFLCQTRQNPSQQYIQYCNADKFQYYAIRKKAHVCGYEAGDFIHTFGDAHIYNNHLEQLELQLTREPKQLPELKILKDIKIIDDFKFEDFEILNYDPHPHIKGKVAI